MPRGGKREGAGRKPKADEKRIRDYTSPYIDNAVQIVVDIMQNAEKDSDRLAAAKLLLSYDWGMPSQQIEHTGKAFEQISINLIEKTDG